MKQDNFMYEELCILVDINAKRTNHVLFQQMRKRSSSAIWWVWYRHSTFENVSWSCLVSHFHRCNFYPAEYARWPGGYLKPKQLLFGFIFLLPVNSPLAFQLQLHQLYYTVLIKILKIEIETKEIFNRLATFFSPNTNVLYLFDQCGFHISPVWLPWLHSTFTVGSVEELLQIFNCLFLSSELRIPKPLSNLSIHLVLFSSIPTNIL